MIGGLFLLGVIAGALALFLALAIAAFVWLRVGPRDDGAFDGIKELAAAERMKVTFFRGVDLSGSFRGRAAYVRWRSKPDRTELSVTTACRSIDARAGAAPGGTRTGDTELDEAVTVRGKDVPALLALLDQDTRRMVRELLADGGRIEPGTISARSDGLRTAALAVTEHLTRLSALAARLESLEAQPVPARLAAIAGSDAKPGVRRRALEIVVEKFGSTAFAAEAARRALADPDSGVRAQAAPLESNGAAGDALAAAVRDERASEKDRRDALARAAAVLDRDDMVALYEAALSSKIPALQRDGVSGFARLRHGPGIARLARLGSETDDELTLTDLADALATIAGPGAEAALLALLDREIPAVQVEAARGLGKIGSPSSIARLKPMAAVVLGPPEVREAAADAIAAIRTRHPGVGEEPAPAKRERSS